MGLLDSREKRSVISLAQWYRSATFDRAGMLQDAKPAPALFFQMSAKYVHFVTARAGEFILWMDDNDPGSIPTEQRLGTVATSGDVVIQRVIDTTKWFADQQIAADQIERGTFYTRVVRGMATSLRMVPTEIEARRSLLKLAINNVPTDPGARVNELGILGQELKRLGQWQSAALARYWAGRACESAAAAGDERIKPGQALWCYELSRDLIPAGQEGLLPFYEDLQSRLRVLTPK